jgi:hypothetical protein
MHGSNISANRSIKIGPDNGTSHDAQFQILLHLFQEFANSCLLGDSVLQLLSHIPDYSQLIYIKQHSLFKKRQSPPFSTGSKSNPLWFWRTTDARESSWSCIVIMGFATCSMSLLALWIIDYSMQLMKQYPLCLFLSQLLFLVWSIRV